MAAGELPGHTGSSDPPATRTGRWKPSNSPPHHEILDLHQGFDSGPTVWRAADRRDYLTVTGVIVVKLNRASENLLAFSDPSTKLKYGIEMHPYGTDQDGDTGRSQAMAGCDLTSKKCVPCEGGMPVLSPAEAIKLCGQISGWNITPDGLRIRKEWVFKHFDAGMAFFHRVALVANAEGHHPDLHLVGFRNVAVEIWTHAIGGLSENDFILAAKIDELPVELKKSR